MLRVKRNKLRETSNRLIIMDTGDKKTEVRDFTDLAVWKQANQIRILVYDLIKKLPKSEEYNLTSQIRRSSCSIASNIAEGYGRFSYQENTQYCRQARGSLDETRDHLIFIKEIFKDLSLECDKLLEICLDCRKTLNGYIKYLQNQKK